MEAETSPLFVQIKKDDIGHIELYRIGPGGQRKIIAASFPPDYGYEHLGQDLGGGRYVAVAKDHNNKQISSKYAVNTFEVEGAPKSFENRSGKLKMVPQALNAPIDTGDQMTELADLTEGDGLGFGGMLGSGPPRDVYNADGKGTLAIQGLAPEAQLASIMTQRDNTNMASTLAQIMLSQQQASQAAIQAQAQNTQSMMQAISGILAAVLAPNKSGSDTESGMAKLEAQNYKLENDRLRSDNARLSGEVNSLRGELESMRNRYMNDTQHLTTRLMQAESDRYKTLGENIGYQRQVGLNDLRFEQLKMKTGGKEPTMMDYISQFAPMLEPVLKKFMTSSPEGAQMMQQLTTQPIRPGELGLG